MLTALNLSRLAAFAGSVGAALVIFTTSAAPNGKYTAAGVVTGIVSVWLHEEHSTERAATAAAASLTPPPAPTPPALPPEALAALQTLEHLVPGAMVAPGGGLVPPAPPAAA